VKRRVSGGKEFALPPEFGRRLRALRERSGLRQTDVALLLGGGRSQALVSQLETGWLRNPTLGLVVEFLRAVRAKFSEVADVLDEMAGLPPAGEMATRAAVERASAGFGARACRAAKRYDRKVAQRRAAAGRRPEPALKRVGRGQRLAQALAWRREVERRLWQQMTRENLGVEPGLVLCVALVNHGMALWAALRRGGSGPGDRQEQVVAQVEARTGIRRAAPKPAVEFVRSCVERLLAEPESSR